MNNRMLEERSAGAVVFKEKDGIPNFLLLNYPAGHWDFPKGKIEKGELILDTVKREICEETGIREIEIIPDFKKNIEYYYRRNTELVYKQVIYFLARVLTWDITLSYEHKDYIWLDLEQAINKLTYKNSKNTLKDAAIFLDKMLIYRDGFVP